MTLQADAAHYRAMSTAEHKPECPVALPPVGAMWPLQCFDATGHGQHIWHGSSVSWTCGGRCPGCNPPADRALFARLASEIEAHLAARESVDLFGAVGVEPEPEEAS